MTTRTLYIGYQWNEREKNGVQVDGGRGSDSTTLDELDLLEHASSLGNLKNSCCEDLRKIQ